MGWARRLEVAVGRAQYAALTGLVSRALGLSEQLFQVGGVRVPALVRTRRTGVPVVLVHGFGTDKEGWLITASRMPRSRGLVIPDLPGFGGAGAIAAHRAGAGAQAAALAGLFDQLGIARAHVVGSSMGGGVALRLAVDHPTLVASLTLVGSVGPIIEPSFVVQEIQRGANPLVLSGPDDWERFAALVMERRPPMTRAMQRWLATDKAARRVAHEELFSGWLGAVNEAAVPEALEAIQAPTLVVHGTEDRVIHPSTARALAQRMPNARLQMLDRVGHAPQAEVPRRLARLVETHAKRNG